MSLWSVSGGDSGLAAFQGYIYSTGWSFRDTGFYGFVVLSLVYRKAFMDAHVAGAFRLRPMAEGWEVFTSFSGCLG